MIERCLCIVVDVLFSSIPIDIDRGHESRGTLKRKSKGDCTRGERERERQGGMPRNMGPACSGM